MSRGCKKCGGVLHIIEGLYTDRDDMRSDLYCAECDTRWGSRAHGHVKLSEGVKNSTVMRKNRALRTTIGELAIEVARLTRKIKKLESSDE